MTKEHRNRLFRLARMLENWKPKVKFDMSIWIRKGGCHTAACALGSAALHPYFQKVGLRIAEDDDVYGEEGGLASVRGPENDFDGYGVFGLDQDQGNWLFVDYPDKKIKPSTVAKRIRHLLSGKEIN